MREKIDVRVYDNCMRVRTFQPYHERFDFQISSLHADKLSKRAKKESRTWASSVLGKHLAIVCFSMP